MKATQAYENKIKGIQNTSRVELDLNMLSSDLSFKDLRMSLNMKGNESILMNNSILLSNRLRVPNQNKLSNYKRSENKKASLKSQRNQ